MHKNDLIFQRILGGSPRTTKSRQHPCFQLLTEDGLGQEHTSHRNLKPQISKPVLGLVTARLFPRVGFSRLRVNLL